MSALPSVTASAAVNPYLAVSYSELRTEAGKSYTATVTAMAEAQARLDKETIKLNGQEAAFTRAPLKNEVLIAKIRAATTPLFKDHSSTLFNDCIASLQYYIAAYQTNCSLFTDAQLVVLDGLKESHGSKPKEVAASLRKLREDLPAAALENATRLTDIAARQAIFEKALTEGKVKQANLLKNLNEAEFALSPGLTTRRSTCWSGLAIASSGASGAFGGAGSST